MTEKALVFYLSLHPIVGPLLGRQIFYHSPPVAVKMPWLIVTNEGGMPKRLTVEKWTEETETLTLYVDSEDQFWARETADAIILAVNNYRGDMLPVQDAYFRTGTPRDLDNYQGSFRCMIPVYVKHKYETTHPV